MNQTATGRLSAHMTNQPPAAFERASQPGSPIAVRAGTGQGAAPP